MDTKTEYSYTYDPSIESHPLFKYAQQAFEAIDMRFPHGAIDRDFTKRTDKKLLADLKALDKFKDIHTQHLRDNTVDFKSVLSSLKSGDSELLTYYGLGYMRYLYDDIDTKSLFTLAYFDQRIPISEIIDGVSGTKSMIHNLLVIKYPDQHSEALICDLWARNICLNKKFATLKEQNPIIPKYILVSTSPKLLTPILFPYHYLTGDLKFYNGADYSLFEELVVNDTKSPIVEEKPSHISQLKQTDLLKRISIFPPQNETVMQQKQRLKEQEQWEKKRRQWETKNPRIIGYFSDINGLNHEVRHTNNQLAYWDSGAPEINYVPRHRIVCEKGRYKIKIEETDAWVPLTQRPEAMDENEEVLKLSS